MSAIRENGATSGLGVIAAFGYDSRGRRISLTRGNGAVTTYSYDNASRLSQLVQTPIGTANHLTLGFAYNPASQIVSNSRSNEAYTLAPAAGATASTVNGLNQLTLHGGASVTHDARGNITAEGGRTFGYSSENLLTSVAASGWTQTYGYDPLLRLAGTTGAGLPRSHAYDGDDMLVVNRDGQFLTRIVHGPGESEPLYHLDNQGRRYWYHADERGSIVAASDATGAVVSIVPFDEYGNSTASPWVYGYAGAFWLPLGRQYYMRARVYDPALGRFLQADPIGYGDGMNMYVYVRGDPVNFSDPTGTLATCTGSIIPQKACEGGAINGIHTTLVNPADTISGNSQPNPERAGPGLGGSGSIASSSEPIGTDPFGLSAIFGSLVEDLIRLLNPQAISRFPRPVNVTDLGTTEGGFITIRGTVHRTGGDLNIHIDHIEAYAVGRHGVVVQGLEAAVRTARELGLRRVVVTGLLANQVLDTFLRSGRLIPGSQMVTTGGVDYLYIPVEPNTP